MDPLLLGMAIGVVGALVAGARARGRISRALRSAALGVGALAAHAANVPRTARRARDRRLERLEAQAVETADVPRE